MRRFAPVADEALAAALAGARLMLYRGDPGRNLLPGSGRGAGDGGPGLVANRGAVAERVIDGVTGQVAADDETFAAAAIAGLRDDVLRRRWHLAALGRQRGLCWGRVAAEFESLMR